jgi:hypothetical protein
VEYSVQSNQQAPQAPILQLTSSVVEMILIREIHITKKRVRIHRLSPQRHRYNPEWKTVTGDEVVLGLSVDDKVSQNTNEKRNPYGDSNCDAESCLYKEINRLDA